MVNSLLWKSHIPIAIITLCWYSEPYDVSLSIRTMYDKEAVSRLNINEDLDMSLGGNDPVLALAGLLVLFGKNSLVRMVCMVHNGSHTNFLQYFTDY